MTHLWQQRGEAHTRLDGPPVGARGTPPSPLAAEGHQAGLVAVLARHLDEAVPHVAAAQEGFSLALHPRRHRLAHGRPASPEGLQHHRRLWLPRPRRLHRTGVYSSPLTGPSLREYALELPQGFARLRHREASVLGSAPGVRVRGRSALAVSGLSAPFVSTHKSLGPTEGTNIPELHT